MGMIPVNRMADIRRLRIINDSLSALDGQSHLFREAYKLGYPKFSNSKITAFVAMDRQQQMTFVWGRDFFDRLETLDDPSRFVERVTFVLAHETLHIVLRHLERATGKLRDPWNIACDVIVNYLCQFYGLAVIDGSVLAERLPPDWGIDPSTQSTEEIYYILLEHAESVSFCPATGHHDQWENLDEKTREILKDKVSGALAIAGEKDEEAGKSPTENPDQDDGDGSFGGGSAGCGALGELRNVVDAQQMAAPPWDRLLLGFFGSMSMPTVREHWGRPPMRLASTWGKLCLPRVADAIQTDTVHILAALDASGSMDDDDIARMKGILASLPKNYKVTLASFDTQCYLIESFDDVHGGGGTSLVDVNLKAEELGVDCVLCLTDGEFYEDPELTRPEDWVFVVDGTVESIPKESRVYQVN